ncbi:MAG: 8-amino-7-oxononanoate synthase [Thermodesulfobacteriota bacterium]
MDFLNRWLQKRCETGNYRRLFPLERFATGQIRKAGSASDPTAFLDFSSNDYLALSIHPTLIAAARNALNLYGTGAGAARLMSGDLQLYHALEEATAKFKNREAALLFGNGYMANIGVIPALVGRGDVIFSDRLNHASIYDGCRLSRAKLVRFHHNDLGHLEECLKKERGQGRALIIVESLYSMDGDRCPLAGIAQLKDRYGCLLMVDEAHATGIFGAHGGGIIQEEGLEGAVDVAMGTFGKALGSYGAYIAGSDTLKKYLVNRARSFIYSTGLPPTAVAASLAAIELIKEEPQLHQQLLANSAYFKKCLCEAGLLGEPGPSQIIPVMVGDSHQAVKIAEEFRNKDVLVTAVRPPTVPEGTARLRFSVTLHQSRQDLAETAGLLMEICKKLSVPVSFTTDS